MTKTHRKAATSADEAFNRHYAAIWGEERWSTSLLPALLKPTRYVCLLNRYTALDDGLQRISDSVPEAAVSPLSFPVLSNCDGEAAIDGPYKPNCYMRNTRASDDRVAESSSPGDAIATFSPPAVAPNGLLSHWNLDAASVLVAHILEAQPGDHVLDLCAAPGGKSVAIAQTLWPHLHVNDSRAKLDVAESGQLRSCLHSNEADGTRHRRLADNVRSYLPKALFDRNQLTVLRVDGAKPRAEYELRVKTANGTCGYTKVLVDAPCSSERHILHAHAKAASTGRVANEMANWRPGSSKRLAARQIDLLMTGLKAADVNATVVYATCSIEPTENDGVVEKVVATVEKERKKRGLKWTVAVGLSGGKGNEHLEADLERQWAERTKYGWIVLPDHPAGGNWGPLFFAVLTKIEGT